MTTRFATRVSHHVHPSHRLQATDRAGEYLDVNKPTVVRFALYVSLGIEYWLGAAFVKRWLGTLLGS